jgi:hypothetical protein
MVCERRPRGEPGVIDDHGRHRWFYPPDVAGADLVEVADRLLVVPDDTRWPGDPRLSSVQGRVALRVGPIELARAGPEPLQHLHWQLRDPRGADRDGGCCCAHGGDDGQRLSHRRPIGSRRAGGHVSAV